MAAGDLVFLTGATGFLGFRVLLYALEHGYQVRAAVRSQAKADTITSNAAFKALKRASQLTFVIVPDFLASGAFDEPVKDAKYLIHVASPLAGHEPEDGDYEKYFVTPAVQGTLGVLEAAKKAGSVKRMVITSSAVANTGPDFGGGRDVTWTAEHRHATEKGPFPSSQYAYGASKVAALNEAERWVAEEKPEFDVVHINPAFICGKDALATSTADFKSGSNSLFLALPLGMASKAVPIPMVYTHIDDSALAHVLSLDSKRVPGNQSYMFNNPFNAGESWDDVFPIVERLYPEEVKKGLFKKGETWAALPVKADVRKTEETFGIKPATLEEVVKSLLDQFVELYRQEQAQQA